MELLIFIKDKRIEEPVLVAQWAKPLLIGYSACRPYGLRALANLGSHTGLEGFISLINPAGTL